MSLPQDSRRHAHLKSHWSKLCKKIHRGLVSLKLLPLAQNVPGPHIIRGLDLRKYECIEFQTLLSRSNPISGCKSWYGQQPYEMPTKIILRITNHQNGERREEKCIYSATRCPSGFHQLLLEYNTDTAKLQRKITGEEWPMGQKH